MGSKVLRPCPAETVSTLRFGQRAKQIKNKLRKHVGYGGTDMDEVLLKREQEIELLQGRGGGLHLSLSFQAPDLWTSFQAPFSSPDFSPPRFSST